MNWGILVMLVSVTVLAGSNRVFSELTENGQTLRVMSYNIRHGVGMDGKLDLKRIAVVIAKFKPDVVALQEVDKNCKRSGSRDIAAELGEILGMQSRFGKFMDYDGGEYGMAVLSKLPIGDTVCHKLPTGAEPRCALEVQVQVDGWDQPLSFVCIHNDWITEEIRTRQIQALLDALEKHSNPTILAGDFNGEKAEPSLELLVKQQWNILDKQGKKTWPSDKPEVEIDFVVIRDFPEASIVHGVVDEKEASDHRPIYAEFSF